MNEPNSFITQESFTIASYADSSLSDVYDSKSTLIYANMPCNSPCKECDTVDLDLCSKCFDETELADYDQFEYYLDETDLTCLDTCPDGQYPNAQTICRDCYTDCLTCSDYEVCTSCDTEGGLPFYFDGYCYPSCPDGSYLDGEECIACDETCFTCSDSADYCLTCDSSENSLYQYYSDFTCVNECGDGYAIDG